MHFYYEARNWRKIEGSININLCKPVKRISFPFTIMAPLLQKVQDPLISLDEIMQVRILVVIPFRPEESFSQIIFTILSHS